MMRKQLINSPSKCGQCAAVQWGKKKNKDSPHIGSKTDEKNEKKTKKLRGRQARVDRASRCQICCRTPKYSRGVNTASTHRVFVLEYMVPGCLLEIFLAGCL